MLEGDTNLNNTNVEEERTFNPHSFDVENQIAGDGGIVGKELLFKQGIDAWLWENTVFYIMTNDICKGHPGYVTVHPGILWNETNFANRERAEIVSLNTYPLAHSQWHTLFVPICVNRHWYLAVLKTGTNEVIWYDSFRRSTLSPNVKERLQWIYKVTTGRNLKLDFKGEGYYGTSQVQTDNYNCGPYTCMYAKHIISGEPMVFGKAELIQKRIPWFTLLARCQNVNANSIDMYIQQFEIQIGERNKLGQNTSMQTKYLEKVKYGGPRSTKLIHKSRINPLRKVADTSNKKRINSSVSNNLKVPLFQDTLCDIDKSTEPINKDVIERVDYNHSIRTIQE